MPKPSNLLNAHSYYDTFPKKDAITRHEYRLITESFMNILINMCYEGKYYHLPGIGLFGIKKKVGTGRPPMDFKHYVETGERRILRNWHSNRKIARFQLLTRGSLSPLLSIFKGTLKLKMLRSVKRTLAQKLKNDLDINIFYEAY